MLNNPSKHEAHRHNTGFLKTEVTEVSQMMLEIQLKDACCAEMLTVSVWNPMLKVYYIYT
jgi:hypothetical protein